MEETAKFIIQNITGSDDFEISSEEIQDRLIITVKANKDIVGLIIGKEGKTIKNIRKVLSISATQSDQSVSLEIEEK